MRDRLLSLRVTVGYNTLRIVYHSDPATFNPTMSALTMSAKAASPLGYLLLLDTGNGEGREEMMYFHTGIKLKLLRYSCLEGNSRCEVTSSGAGMCLNNRLLIKINCMIIRCYSTFTYYFSYPKLYYCPPFPPFTRRTEQSEQYLLQTQADLETTWALHSANFHMW